MIGTPYMLLDGRGCNVWLYEKHVFILYLKWLPNSSPFRDERKPEPNSNQRFQCHVNWSTTWWILGGTIPNGQPVGGHQPPLMVPVGLYHQTNLSPLKTLRILVDKNLRRNIGKYCLYQWFIPWYSHLQLEAQFGRGSTHVTIKLLISLSDSRKDCSVKVGLVCLLCYCG